MFAIFKIILYYILQGYAIIVSLDIIFSLFSNSYEYKFPRIVHTVANWFMGPFEGLLILGRIDFSRLIGVIVLEGILSFCFI